MNSNVYLLVVVLASLLLLQVGCAYEHVYPRTDSGTFEIKRLPASTVLLAQTEESYFQRSDALFNRLFSYIEEHEIAMTVPVEMRTVPPTMIFFVGTEPSDRELESTEEVKITKFPERMVVSHGARGSYTEENFRESAERLQEWLGKKPEYRSAGRPYAVYWDGPFKPGFLKRYEVHIPIEEGRKDQPMPDIFLVRPESEGERLDLDEYEWENRLLLVFASQGGTDKLDDFRSALKKELAGVVDRDLLMIPVLNSDGNSGDDKKWSNASKLRQNYGAQDKNFLVVLVGKDGTEKRRWAEVPQIEQIFEIIDAMPMRLREMRENQASQ